MNGTRKKEGETGREGVRVARQIVTRFTRWLSLLQRRLKGLLASARLSEEKVAALSSGAVPMFYLCSGFLLGTLDLGLHVYPLGIALMIASEKYTLAAFIGSALATLTYPSLSLSFFGVNSLIYIIRKVLLSSDHSESLRTRVILGVTTGVFISAALLLSDASTVDKASALFGRYDIIPVMVSYLLIIPLSVFLLYPILSKRSFSKNRACISFTFLGFCLTAALSRFSVIGTFLSHFSAVFISLLYSVTFDPASAVCSSALFGLSAGGCPFGICLSLSVFLFTRLYEKRQILAYPLLFVSLSLLSMILCDLTKTPYLVLSACLSGVAVFMPIGLILCAGRTVSALSAPPSRESVGEAYTRRMAMLSGAFGSVSRLCFGFAARMKLPSEDEARVLIAVEASRVCTKCKRSRDCKKKSLWCTGGLAADLCGGRLTVDSVPETLRAVCDSTREILSGINEEYRRLLSDRFRNNKVEILAREYACVAKILKYTSRLSSQDVTYDGPLTARGLRAAERLGLEKCGVTVYGSRKKILDVCSVPVSKVTLTSGELASYFSKELGIVLGLPEFILDEDNTFTMRFTSKELIAVEYAKAVHSKCGEVVSGDTVSFFESSDSYFYALIADGMGSGRDAAMTSRMTSVFVEKLLSGGVGKGVTMELLNSVLMSKSSEVFSSVDLLEVDLINRRASFIKAGAAPAYLLRATKLFKVSSDTPPCGIIEGFCAENTSFDVFSGDIIIMLSDGITSAIDCNAALSDVMKEHRTSPSEVIVEKILDLATSAAVHDDDMSCVLVRVK